jgi:hypothetical protein
MPDQAAVTPTQAAPSGGPRRQVAQDTYRIDGPEGAGWLLFAGIMVMIAGILNIIWGIAAIDKSKFFTANATYILSSLNTWGWIVLVIGVLEIIAAFSIWAGGQYGRWFGIMAAGANSIAALMTIPAYPFWGLCLFGIDLLIIYGLAAYGGQRRDIA